MGTFLTVVLYFVGFLLFAWIARRLLGVRYLSAIRTLLAALIGMGIGALIAWLLERRGVDADSALVSGIVLGIIFTMVAIVAIELISRPGHRPTRPRVGVPHPVAAVRKQIDVSRRMAEVTAIGARHGLGPSAVDEDGELIEGPAATGRQMRKAFEDAGGMFIKLGQLLSTRTDIIDPEMAAELAELQKAVTPVPREIMEPVLVEELDGPSSEVFTDFDWDPLGSASIGQVYRATLASGQDVVVKIQRPGIRETVEVDGAIVLRIAATIQQRTAWGTRYGVSGLAEEFVADLKRELDYTIEARNAIEVGQAAADDSTIRVPAIYEDLSTSKVLVMERLDGSPVSDLPPADPSTEAARRHLADDLFRAEIGAMVDGERFHSDPHPGNVLVLADGTLGLIDFGSAGRLDAFERAAVSDILLALRLRDPTLLSEAALEVATVEEDTDTLQLERAFAQLMARRLGPHSKADAELIQEFLAIVFEFGMKPPASITSMFRAMGTLDGTLNTLSPGYPMIEAAEKLAADEMQRWLEPDSLSELVQNETIRLAPIMQRLPRHVDRIAAQLERGELTTRVSLFSTKADARVITRLANRFTLAFLGAALGIVSVMLLTAPGGPQLTDDVSLFDVLGYLGLFGGAILVMRVVLEVLRDSD